MLLAETLEDAQSWKTERSALYTWHSDNMKLNLTTVFKKVPEGYIAFVEELPGANTQGRSLEEAR